MDIEKKEFIEKHFALFELHRPGDLSVRAFSSSWAGPVFLAIFFAGCVVYIDRDLSRFLGGLIPALKQERSLTFVLIVVAVPGFRSVTKSITERRQVKKELIALRFCSTTCGSASHRLPSFQKRFFPAATQGNTKALPNGFINSQSSHLSSSLLTAWTGAHSMLTPPIKQNWNVRASQATEARRITANWQYLEVILNVSKYSDCCSA